MKLFEMPIYYRSKDEFLKDKVWRSYNYNEVIGWVSLETSLNTIRAEYWGIRQRPTKVLIKKEFEHKGKLFKVSIRNLSSPEIFKSILRGFNDWQEDSYLSRFYFDLEAFYNVGKYIDWRHLANEHSILQDN